MLFSYLLLEMHHCINSKFNSHQLAHGQEDAMVEYLKLGILMTSYMALDQDQMTPKIFQIDGQVNCG